MKTLVPALVAEKNTLSTTSAWLILLQVSLPDGTTLYLVPNPSVITFDGQAYTPFACTIDSVKTDSKGGLADVMVAVSNVDRTMSAYVETQELRGAPVRVLIVNSLNLADPSALAADEEYQIGEIVITQDWVTFRLGHQRFLQQRFPNGRFLRDNCRWIYKTTECGFIDGVTGPGTISSSSVTITGVNTDFLTRFKTGDTLTASAQTRIVNVVTSATIMTVTIAPSPAWSAASYTFTKPTCSKILEGDNGCRAHSNQGRFGAYPGIPSVAGRL